MVICSLLIVCTLVKWPLCVAVRTENRFSTVPPQTPTRSRSRFIALTELIPVRPQMDSLVDVGGLLMMMMMMMMKLTMMISSYQTTFQFQLRSRIILNRRRAGRRLQVSQRSRRRTRVCEYWRVMPRSTFVVSTSTWIQSWNLVCLTYRYDIFAKPCDIVALSSFKRSCIDHTWNTVFKCGHHT